jgi:DNA gyrase/topoisomerase IV subunit A
MPAKGEIFLIATDGKAKRVPVKDFPTQGRYGRGVIAWQLPKGVNLAGTGTGKPNSVATVHLLNLAPKSTRLDAAPVRKRAAVRGDVAVEVKAGDTITAVVTGWEVENFVSLVEEKKPARKAPAKRKPAATSSSKGRKTTTKKPATKAKPAATSSSRGKKPTSRKATAKK